MLFAVSELCRCMYISELIWPQLENKENILFTVRNNGILTLRHMCARKAPISSYAEQIIPDKTNRPLKKVGVLYCRRVMGGMYI